MMSEWTTNLKRLRFLNGIRICAFVIIVFFLLTGNACVLDAFEDKFCYNIISTRGSAAFVELSSQANIENYIKQNTGDDVIMKFLEVLASMPDSGAAFYSLVEMYPLFFDKMEGHYIKNKNETYFYNLILSMNKHDGEPAAKIILAMSVELVKQKNRILKELNRRSRQEDNNEPLIHEGERQLLMLDSTRIYKGVLENQKYRKYHPLCGILLTMSFDFKNDPASSMNRDHYLEKYYVHNDAYRAIVTKIKNDIELDKLDMFSPEYFAKNAELFDYCLSYPLVNLDFSENPIPCFLAYKTAISCVDANLKESMIKRLLPLLNNVNDPPYHLCLYRVLLWYYLAQVYRDSGRIAESIDCLDNALNLVQDQELYNFLKDYKNKIISTQK